MRSPRRPCGLPPARLPVLAFLLAAVLSLVLVPAGAGATAPAARDSPQVAARDGAAGTDPRLRREIYLNRDSQAYAVSRVKKRFRPIGQTPQAFWVSRGWFPLDTVRRQVHHYARLANRAHRTPLLAVYDIPHRDCGGAASSWTGKRYRTWTTRIARGLAGQHAIVVLEPDALPLLDQCGNERRRTALVRHATRALASRGVWVYIDAGHNAWNKPRVIARRLEESGVARARGFSVNVASFVRSPVEKGYARRVHRALVARGVHGAHYVMDTSRNGHGKRDGNDWCNPLDARLGATPRIVGKRLDRLLWVKGPGESDGHCNGGPDGGLWWSEYALRLMGEL